MNTYIQPIALAMLLVSAQAMAERPAMQDAPADRFAEPTVIEEPAAVNEPAAIDEPAAVNEPVVIDEPAATTEPAASTAPVATEVEHSSGDVLEMQASETLPVHLLDFPRRGMSMEKVQNELGQPGSITPAVGEPPITTWVYPDRNVYFEYSSVIHAVATR
jgi:hypothetical protein